MHFWKHINNARFSIKNRNENGLTASLESILQYLESRPKSEIIEKEKFFGEFTKTYKLNALVDSILAARNSKATSKVNNNSNIELDSYVESIGEGVSLVTCCMNRNENLIKALPSWIENKGIDEIIIVDWSSKEPVHECIVKNGLADSRIKVIRVDDQPRWILSYAFNLGFRAASFNKILKTDADIIIYSDFFEKNSLSENTFIAGNWRNAPAGQEHINGFFYVSRENLLHIKGFNEYITTYGWDDDDIYHRLDASGIKRTQVNIDTIYHIPHDDALRIDSNNPTIENHLTSLHCTPKFKIRTNRFIANAMPTWNKDRVFLPFTITENESNFLRLKQNGESIHYVPKHIRDDAEYYAELELTSWKAGLRAFDLNRENLRKLLRTKPLEKIRRLDIEIANYNQNPDFKLSQNYLLIEIKPAFAEKNKKEIIVQISKLATLAKEQELGLAIVCDRIEQVSQFISNVPQMGFVPRWRNLGKLHSIKPNQLADITGHKKENFILQLDTTSLNELKNSKTQSPQILIKRDKLFIDTQHGLGNRLRALASGAAIAAATDRELVIVWEPDHHCECRLSDLYSYTGAVIEKSFVTEAYEKDLNVYNYMEIEANANKDAPIIVTAGKDIYARSAYVLNSEYTDWKAENKFLRSLTPVEQINDLVAPFNTKNRIGAHVRMEAGKGLDHNTYDSIENWTQEGHDLLHYWRDKSHYSHFIKRIDQLFSENQSQKLFLATDLPETYRVFEEYYGDKLAYLKRNTYDRSREQIIFALADAILLSRCQQLLGSTWSSFSELAMRLSTTYSKIEMSGKDF